MTDIQYTKRPRTIMKIKIKCVLNIPFSNNKSTVKCDLIFHNKKVFNI